MIYEKKKKHRHYLQYNLQISRYSLYYNPDRQRLTSVKRSKGMRAQWIYFGLAFPREASLIGKGERGNTRERERMIC